MAVSGVLGSLLSSGVCSLRRDRRCGKIRFRMGEDQRHKRAAVRRVERVFAALTVKAMLRSERATRVFCDILHLHCGGGAGGRGVLRFTSATGSISFDRIMRMTSCVVDIWAVHTLCFGMCWVTAPLLRQACLGDRHKFTTSSPVYALAPASACGQGHDLNERRDV